MPAIAALMHSIARQKMTLNLPKPCDRNTSSVCVQRCADNDRSYEQPTAKKLKGCTALPQGGATAAAAAVPLFTALPTGCVSFVGDATCSTNDRDEWRY